LTVGSLTFAAWARAAMLKRVACWGLSRIGHLAFGLVKLFQATFDLLQKVTRAIHGVSW
jgi:hypothetical protein